MLKRNMSVKTAPQRWQDNAADGCFDVVLSFEDRVFDMVVEGESLLCFFILFLVIYFFFLIVGTVVFRS